MHPCALASRTTVPSIVANVTAAAATALLFSDRAPFDLEAPEGSRF
jgi:hypothetical protein